MYKTKQIPQIGPEQQKKLYTHGLLEAMLKVDGIGQRRLRKLQSELEQQYANEKVNPEYCWVYRLVLAVINQPLDAEQLCTPHEDGRSILERLTDIDAASVRTVNAILSNALSPQEKQTVMSFYRDQLSLEQITQQLNRSNKTASKLKGTALHKLRRPMNAKVLSSIILDD